MTGIGIGKGSSKVLEVPPRLRGMAAVLSMLRTAHSRQEACIYASEWGDGAWLGWRRREKWEAKESPLRVVQFDGVSMPV